MEGATRVTHCLMMMVVGIALMPGLVTSSSTLTNVALNKPAAQSSVSPDNPSLTADKVVDGNKDTYFEYCQHTDQTSRLDHWLLIDLQGFYTISSVEITNRGDCCGDRLRDFDIQVYMLNPMNTMTAKAHLCHHYNGSMGTGATELLPCSQPTTGRYVRIILSKTDEPLHVCEVEVMARTAASTSRRYVRTKQHKAEGDLIQEATSYGVTRCLMWCSSDVSCNAVNMGPKTWTSAGWSRVCQLLSFGGISQPDSTTPDPDWDFYGIGDP